METRKLDSTDAFVVFDLEGAERAAGVVRLAPKILVDGAVNLARSQTYEFASFEQAVGGASAGINAKPDGRDAAVKAFAAEVGDWVAGGSLSLDPAKGVTVVDLEPLAALDRRAALARTAQAELTGISVAVATEAALGGVDGKTVGVEGLDVLGPAGVEAIRRLAERGAKVTVVGTSAGTAAVADGVDPEVLAGAFAEHGADLVGRLVQQPGKAWDAIGAEVDVLLAGSKAGVLTHDNTAHVRAGLVVPAGRLPVTAKALAELRRRGTLVLPDFLTLAGPGLVAWAEPAPTEIEAATAIIDPAVRGALGEVLGHEDGPLLAACYRAETFLRTWRETLPFGRPLA
jgi:glutamate dehydrogenase (NAD(P)+)